jgi:hypothetical protein
MNSKPIPLSVMAMVSDGHRVTSHNVEIVPSSTNIESLNGKPVLRIIGVGGSWYLHTLFEGKMPHSKLMPIDMGAGVVCVNFDVVLAEAVYLLARNFKF